MNIILVSNNMAKAKTLSILQVSMIVFALVMLPVLFMLMFIVPQEPSAQKGVKSLIPHHLRFSFNNPQKHLDAYAVQLGEMQARLMRLDAQSERLAKLAGDKKTVRNNKVEPSVSPKPNYSPTSSLDPVLANPVNASIGANQGGPLVHSAPLSEAELQTKIAELMEKIEVKTEYLSDIEAKLLQQSVLKNTLPNSSPVDAAFNSSSFGWRLDPFNGSKAFHDGYFLPQPVLRFTLPLAVLYQRQSRPLIMVKSSRLTMALA